MFLYTLYFDVYFFSSFILNCFIHCRCDGHSKCEVMASNSVFGDPCKDTFKYLQVYYTCQPIGEINLSFFWTSESTYNRSESSGNYIAEDRVIIISYYTYIYVHLIRKFMYSSSYIATNSHHRNSHHYHQSNYHHQDHQSYYHHPTKTSLWCSILRGEKLALHQSGRCGNCQLQSPQSGSHDLEMYRTKLVWGETRWLWMPLSYYRLDLCRLLVTFMLTPSFQVRILLTPHYIYVISLLQVRILLTPHYIYVDSLLQVRILLTPHYINVDSLLQVRFKLESC